MGFYRYSEGVYRVGGSIPSLATTSLENAVDLISIAISGYDRADPKAPESRDFQILRLSYFFLKDEFAFFPKKKRHTRRCGVP